MGNGSSVTTDANAPHLDPEAIATAQSRAAASKAQSPELSESYAPRKVTVLSPSSDRAAAGIAPGAEEEAFTPVVTTAPDSPTTRAAEGAGSALSPAARSSGAGGAPPPQTVHLQAHQVTRSSSGGGGGLASRAASKGGLRVGQRVRVGGLENATYLNGQEGVLTSWESDLGRWVIRLRSGEEKGVRPSNLTHIGGGSAGVPGGSSTSREGGSGADRGGSGVGADRGGTASMPPGCGAGASGADRDRGSSLRDSAGGGDRGGDSSRHGALVAGAAGSGDAVFNSNKDLERLLLQTNWSAIYQVFYQRFGISGLEALDHGIVVKAAVEMTLSIVAKCFALLRSDPSGRLHCTPLHIAALQNSPEAAEVIVREMPQLVEQTHRPSHTALCPLHIAILCSSQAIVELLLAGQANPNVRTLHDVCPIHLAASTSKELCQLLCAYHADLNKREVMGSTAIHYAASFKQHATMEFLVANGVQKLASDGDAKRVTPLHVTCALFSSDDDLVAPMTLLANGAKPWQTDISGASPRDVVVPGRGVSLQHFFESHGDSAQAAAQRWLEARLESEAQQGQLINQAYDEGWVEHSEATFDPSSPSRAARLSLDGAGGSASPGAGLSVSARGSAGSGAGGAAVAGAGGFAELERVRALQAEVESLKQQLASKTARITQLDKVESELEAARQKCEVLDQSNAHQQKNFEALQALCENTRAQYQARLEEAQQRALEERRDWEQRLMLQVEAARTEEKLSAAQQLETKQRELDMMREEWEAKLMREEPSEQPPAFGATAVANKLMEHLREGGGFESGASRTEIARLQEAHKEEEAKNKKLSKQLREVAAALVNICKKNDIKRPADDDESRRPDLRELLVAIGAELERLRMQGGGIGSEVKSMQDQLHQLSEEAAELRSRRNEAEDRCAKLQLERQDAESKGSAKEIQLRTQLGDLELQHAQALAAMKGEVESAARRIDLAKTQGREAAMAQVQPVIDGLKDQLRVLQGQFHEEQQLRKKYHNQIQDMKGAIRVFCRVRPQLKRERDLGDTLALRRTDAFTVQLSRPICAKGNDHLETKNFQFDSVFEQDSRQDEVFSECKDLVQSAIDGYNVTIFAYGQTGAGKTFTMYGTPGDPGLAPRAIQSLFDVIRREQNRGGKSFRVRSYMIEVYKQDIIDLLAERPQEKRSLEVKRDAGRGIMYVEGVTERICDTAEELQSLLVEGEKKRHVTATKMNSTSSRSHLLLSIVVEATVKEPEQVIYGKITLCDLAGSERPKKSEVSGDALKEAIEINKSLSALGDVIEALTKGSKNVPYRNHKLTMLMQDSLGGSAKTLMFVNCSPASSNAEETQMSLKWASRARQVTNDVRKNADSKEVARLKQVIAMMSQAQSVQDDAADAGGAEAAAGPVKMRKEMVS